MRWDAVWTLTFALAALATACARAGAERVFLARDFGAVPDTATDAGPALRTALRAAIAAGPGAVLELEAGVYRLRGERPKTYCLPIEQASGLTIRGAGMDRTRLVVTDPTCGLVNVSRGSGVTVRDFAVDYDPLPFTQGTVRRVDPEGGSFDLEIQEGYPTPDAPNFTGADVPYGRWGMVMDRATRRIRAGTPDHFMTPRWERVEGRVWRFFTEGEHYRRSLVHLREGDAYVHLARGHAGSVLMAWMVEGVRFEKVRIHASPGLAVGLVGNRGEAVVRGVEVRFPRQGDRLLTTNADGVHCQQNRVGPVVESCFFEGMADDGVNVYAPPNTVREVVSEREWLVTAGCLLLPGDRLQVVDPRTGAVRGEVRVASATYEGGLYRLTLEAPFAGAMAGEDHRSGDTLYNLSACGAGFRIRNNTMRGNRRYGCLLRAGDGLVEGNTFEDTTGAGVMVTNEPDWPEGPVPWNITVRGNRFVRGGACLGYADSPGGGALQARASALGFRLAEGMPLRGLIVERNTFEDIPGAAIYLGAVRDATLRGNRIVARAGAQRLREGGVVVLERTAEVRVSGGRIEDPRPGTTAAFEVRPDVAPGPEGLRVERTSVRLRPGAPLMDDRRAR